MEIRPSPEIEAVVTRWVEAIVAKRGAVLENLLSRSEHLRYIGSDEGEYWEGALLRQGIAAHAAEVPEFTSTCLRKEAFEAGDVGWASWIGEVRFADRQGVSVVRYSWVLALEDGAWRIVHSHTSFPTANVALFGKEHTAFDALIAAARAAEAALGTEGMVVLMFTDVADSTALAERLGDRAWAETIGALLARQRAAIEGAGGRVIKTLGDGAMAAFGSAGGALRAAVRIQAEAGADAAPGRGAGGSGGPQLALRIGIHAGEAIRAEGDFFGTVVNKAARIAALARKGEVLVSETVRMMAGEAFAFGAPAEVVLRGVEGTHRVAALEGQKTADA